MNSTESTTSNSQQSNILHIMVDQMRFDCIAALGNQFIKTPSLDRLVQKGVSFSRAYSPCPVCIPARASMIYGQYPQTTGCYENNFPMPGDSRPSFMESLTQAGYRTHGIGKCHFTPDPLALKGFQSRETQEELPDKREDDDYLTFLHTNGYSHVIDPHGVRGAMYYIPQVSQIPKQFHPTQWVGDRTIKFLDESQAHDQPWYLYSSFIHPHPPLSPPSPWHKMYNFDDVPLPHIPLDHEALLFYVNRAQNRYKYRDQGFDLNLLRMIRAYYYASISFIDHQIGRMLDQLESNGGINNTLIVFTSDHGEYLGDYHCYGKRGMHDVAARIPFVVYQPEVFEGGITNQEPVSLVDLAPTFLQAARSNDKNKQALDGVPLQDVMTGQSRRPYVFAQHSFVKQADGTSGDQFYKNDPIPDQTKAASSTYLIVSRDSKYIYSAADNKEVYFDLQKDPGETRNRVHVQAHQDNVKKLRQDLLGFLKEKGETQGILEDHWVEFPVTTLPDDPDYGLLTQNQPWAELM